MPSKKTKQQSLNKENIYVVLRNNKTCEHHVLPRDQLLCAKKDGLKVGTFATFNGGDDPSKRCRGTIIMSGTKQQCENSVSLIEKTNNNNPPVEPNNNNNNNNNNNPPAKSNKNNNNPPVESKKNPPVKANNNSNNNPSVESESDSSNQLIIDDKTEESDDDNNNNEESEDESEISTYTLTSQQPVDATGTSNKSSTSSITTSANNSSPSSSSSFLPPTTASSSNMALTEINNNIDVIPKRKEVPEETTSDNKKKQRTSKISHSEHEKLKREVSRLQKEITMFKTNWMPRPTGSTINYFIEIGKILSGQSIDDTNQQGKEDKLTEIRTTLDISEADLCACVHDTDITKTCRQIIKFIYRNRKERSTMLVSLINKNKLQAIQEYARLAHPAQSKTPNSILNNAIGNVFATEKRRQEKKDSDNDSVEDDDDNTQE